MDILPCGCTVDKVEETRTMVYVPCHLDCEFYLWVIAYAESMGKPVSYDEAP